MRVVLVGGVLLGGACAKPPQPELDPTVEESAMDEQLLELIGAERGFARMADEQGIRQAFLAHLADSSTVFLPRPVAGRPAYEAMEATNALLSWWPAYAELSAAGDLGFTTGPWELRGERGASVPHRAGQYLSFWSREDESHWRVRVDLGILHEPMASPVPSFCRGRRAALAPAGQAAASRPTMREAESRLRQWAAQQGYGPAILQLASPDIRVLRHSRVPGLGLADARAMLGAQRDSLVIVSERSLEARSHDLGAVFGEQRLIGEAGSASTYGFLRAWRREREGWRLIVDALLPISAEEGR